MITTQNNFIVSTNHIGNINIMISKKRVLSRIQNNLSKIQYNFIVTINPILNIKNKFINMIITQSVSKLVKSSLLVHSSLLDVLLMSGGLDL